MNCIVQQECPLMEIKSNGNSIFCNVCHLHGCNKPRWIPTTTFNQYLYSCHSCMQMGRHFTLNVVNKFGIVLENPCSARHSLLWKEIHLPNICIGIHLTAMLAHAWSLALCLAQCLYNLYLISKGAILYLAIGVCHNIGRQGNDLIVLAT